MLFSIEIKEEKVSWRKAITLFRVEEKGDPQRHANEKCLRKGNDKT